LYHDCIKTFCKERHFTQEGKKKNATVWKPCGGKNKGVRGKKEQPELSRLPVCFLSIVSEKVIIFGMLHYILNIAMQNVT
jgi:hypothetical protein